MGWLDAWTGKAAKRASQAQVRGLENAQGDLRSAQGAALGSIDQGTQAGLGYISSGAMPALSTGYGDALGALGRLYGDAQSYGGQATAAFDPMIAASVGGVGAYGDAAGANGVAGNARAVQNFQAGPGYEFARDQGLDSIARMANTRGQLAGGNTSVDLLKYSTGLADQTWGSYMSRLQPLMQMYGTGIAGRAGGLSNQAGMAQNMGTAEAELNRGLGAGMSVLYGTMGGMETEAGSNRANILSQIGQQMAQLSSGIGQTQGQGIMGAANARAGTINAGLGLVGQLAGLPMAGGGSLGGNMLSRVMR